LKVNAAAKENKLPLSAGSSDFQSSGSLDKVPWHFHHPPTKKVTLFSIYFGFQNT